MATEAAQAEAFDLNCFGEPFSSVAVRLDLLVDMCGKEALDAADQLTELHRPLRDLCRVAFHVQQVVHLQGEPLRCRSGEGGLDQPVVHDLLGRAEEGDEAVVAELDCLPATDDLAQTVSQAQRNQEQDEGKQRVHQDLSFAVEVRDSFCYITKIQNSQ